MESSVIVPNVVTLETRQLWWNINSPWSKFFFYFLIFIAVCIFLYGIYQKILIISAAKFPKGENRFSNVFNRLVYVFKYAFLHKKTSQKKTPGLAHAGIFLGFMTLWIVTNIVGVQDHSSVYFFQGTFYKLVSFFAELGGLFLF